MPKKDLDHYLKKLRKIEKKILKSKSKRKRRVSSSSSYSENETNPRHSGLSATDNDSEIELIEENSNAQASTELPQPMELPQPTELPQPSGSMPSNTLPDEVLLALGDLMPDKPEFGPEINENLARIWSNILKTGLPKESKQKIMEQLIPNNCQLLKAPKLNPEIISSVTDNIVNRDKKIEREQYQLGTGLALLGNALSLLLTNDEVDKVKLIAILSDCGRILTDLHNTQTKSRKNLIFPLLDKKFIENIKDVERDDYLYGQNLIERIKSITTLQRNSQSIKKQSFTNPARQGNSNSPACYNHSQRATARPGQKKASSQGTKYRQYYPPAAKKPKSSQPDKPAQRK